MTKLTFRLKHVWIGSQIIVRRFVITRAHPLYFVTDIWVQKTFYNEGKPPKYQGTKITLLICLNSCRVWKTILSDGVLEPVSDERAGLLWLTCRNAKNERKGKEWFHLAHQFLRRNALSLAIFNRFSQYSVLSVVSGRSGHGLPSVTYVTEFNTSSNNKSKRTLFAPAGISPRRRNPEEAFL